MKGGGWNFICGAHSIQNYILNRCVSIHLFLCKFSNKTLNGNKQRKRWKLLSKGKRDEVQWKQTLQINNDAANYQRAKDGQLEGEVLPELRCWYPAHNLRCPKPFVIFPSWFPHFFPPTIWDLTGAVLIISSRCALYSATVLQPPAVYLHLLLFT